jgi:hypothetical protein
LQHQSLTSVHHVLRRGTEVEPPVAGRLEVGGDLADQGQDRVSDVAGTRPELGLVDVGQIASGGDRLGDGVVEYAALGLGEGEGRFEAQPRAHGRVGREDVAHLPIADESAEDVELANTPSIESLILHPVGNLPESVRRSQSVDHAGGRLWADLTRSPGKGAAGPGGG